MQEIYQHDKIIPLFPTLPVAFSYGEGSWLYDTDGNEYLDAMGGMAVCCLGHANPQIAEAMYYQAKKLIHTTNFFQVPNQYKLAEKLTEISGMKKVYFCNSGAEANEAALKISRLFARKKNIDLPKVIVTHKGLHGRTIATLSASDIPGVRNGFDPLLKEFIRVPFNDINSMEKTLKEDKDVVAIMLEPIQGEGGINVFEDGYLKGIRSLCDKYDCLMILDEVQTGIGRTGKWFAFQHELITPDILCLAKALGSGFPIGACLVSGKATDIFQLGNHGSTCGGNPLGTHISREVIEIIEENNLVSNSNLMGEYLKNKLKEDLSKFKCVTEIRGKGLMIGVQINCNAKKLLMFGLKHRIIFNVTHNNVIRILPPLNVSEKECDLIVLRIKKCLQDFEKDLS